MNRLSLALTTYCLIGGLAYEAPGAIIKGSLTLADDAFADSARVMVGDVGSGRPLSELLAGPNLGSSLEIGDFNRGEIVEVSFLDNLLIDRPGHDLVVYEKHNPDGFDLAVQIGPDSFSSYRHFETSSQHFSEDGYVNAAYIDLAAFGLCSFQRFGTIRILEDDFDSAELAGMATLHAVVPEPATLLLGSLCFLSCVMRGSPQAALEYPTR